jgi:hypothetical protein
MSDRQVMVALRRANPEKYASPATPAIATAVKSGARKPETKSAEDTAAKNQREREDRALEEVLAVVGCTLSEHDASRHASAVKRLFREAVGIKNMALAEHVVTQAAASMTFGQFSTEYERLLGAIALMQEIKPANVSEALLACQMNAVHHALMRFLNRATHSEQTFEGADANVLRATRLGRLYIEQLEAMAKLKGKIGQQKVTVEHVHVHEGGQAIVGAVVTPKPSNGGGGQ